MHVAIWKVRRINTHFFRHIRLAVNAMVRYILDVPRELRAMIQARGDCYVCT